MAKSARHLAGVAVKSILLSCVSLGFLLAPQRCAGAVGMGTVSLPHSRAAHVGPGAGLYARVGRGIAAPTGGAFRSRDWRRLASSCGAFPGAFARRIRAHLDDLTKDDLPRETLADADKVFLLRIGPRGSGYEVAVREYDVYTQTFGSVVTRRLGQRQMLGEIAFLGMLEAFAPLGRVEEVDNRTTKLRIRAGELGLRDKSITLLKKGDVFVPRLRFNNSDGSPREIREVPWTYLYTESIEGSLATCHVHTGLRSPLTSRRRGRTEQLGLVVRPPRRNTRMEIYSRTDGDVPLEGYAVYVYGPESPATELLGYTNGRGAIDVPPPPPDVPSLRLLIIKNGGELLAKLPIVPGLEPSTKALVTDDDLRLSVEGFITGLQEEVVDTVARCAVLLALINKRMENGAKDEAKQLLDEIYKLPQREQFLARMATREEGVFTNDPTVQNKVKKLFTDTRTLLDRFLDDKTIKDVAAQLSGPTAGG